jgi:3-dehydroquinate synthetase
LPEIIKIFSNPFILGQSVAIGCVVAARVAVEMGLCAAGAIDRTVSLCAKYSLPTKIPPDQSVNAIMVR